MFVLASDDNIKQGIMILDIRRLMEVIRYRLRFSTVTKR